jgi:parallel beta-helix repeat protein
MKLTHSVFRYVSAAAIVLGLSVFLPNNQAGGAYAKSINVKSYGAKGDGTTDDTQAIKKAISAGRRGDTIYFPTGNYLHSTYLVFSNLMVSGDGASQSLITATDAASGALEFGGEKVGIQKVCVQYANPVDSTSYLANGIWFNLAKNFTVINVIVRNVSANGVSIHDSVLGGVSSSTISSPTETGVYILDCKDVAVSQNTFPLTSTAVFVNNSKLSSALAQNITIHGNQIQNSSGSTATAAIYVLGVSHCSIANNSVNNNPFGGILVQGDNLPNLGKSVDVSVTGNTFSNCALLGNINIDSNSDGSLSPKITVENVTVSGNIMKTNNPSFGILALGASPKTMSNITITNNDVENVPTAPGIYVDNTQNATLKSNTVNQTGFGSIYLGPGNNGAFVINSNVLQNCGPNSAGALPSSHNAAIDLEGKLNGGTSLTSVEIENNSYSGTTTGLADFIFDGAPAHLLKNDAINGNTTTTTLPSIVTP